MSRYHRHVDAVEFAQTVRVLNVAAVSMGLEAVGFRSPPIDPAVTRSLRQRSTGWVVAVRRDDRPAEAVQADMVDGLLAANRVDDPAVREKLLGVVR